MALSEVTSEGDAESALKRLDFSRCPTEEEWNGVWRIGLSTIAAGALKDGDRRKQSIAEWRTLIEKIKTTDAPSADLLSQLCNMFEGGKQTQADLDKIDKALGSWPENSRSFMWYFLGCAFDDQGDKEHADLYWGRTAFREPFDCFATTLAGDRLVKRYGPERGGLPKEYAEQEAKAGKEKGDGEVGASAVARPKRNKRRERERGDSGRSVKLRPVGVGDASHREAVRRGFSIAGLDFGYSGNRSRL
jgi:hypothetical protein